MTLVKGFISNIIDEEEFLCLRILYVWCWCEMILSGGADMIRLKAGSTPSHKPQCCWLVALFAFQPARYMIEPLSPTAKLLDYSS